jgi:hypothetical protein
VTVRRGRGRWATLGVALGIVLAHGADGAAQQRPLVTQDPETIGGGRLLIEAGMEYGTDIFLPVSGLTGDLLQVPVVGVSIGLSSIAELQIDGPLYQRMHVSSRVPAPLEFKVRYEDEHTSDVGDIVLATKLKILSERTTRPSFGLRLATKLPNAGNESGLGTDTLDFAGSLLIGKTRGSTRYVGNLGIAILGDPVRGDRQADVLTYGFSLAHAFREGFEAVGEVNGHFQWAWDYPSPGAESKATFRTGLRYTRGAGRVDGAVIIGTTSRDPDIGFTVGYTHVFDAFPPP